MSFKWHRTVKHCTWSREHLLGIICICFCSCPCNFWCRPSQHRWLEQTDATKIATLRESFGILWVAEITRVEPTVHELLSRAASATWRGHRYSGVLDERARLWGVWPSATQSMNSLDVQFTHFHTIPGCIARFSIIVPSCSILRYSHVLPKFLRLL